MDSEHKCVLELSNLSHGLCEQFSPQSKLVTQQPLQVPEINKTVLHILMYNKIKFERQKKKSFYLF